jgi:uncharacterized membrane protein
MLQYFFIFIIGGLCGWILDTSYRSWVDNHYAPNTLVSFFSIIYGLAATMLYILFASTEDSFYLQIIIGTLMVIILEFFSAIVALKFLKKRFWDYSLNRYNIYGFIDAKHSFYWLILVVVYRLIYPVIF